MQSQRYAKFRGGGLGRVMSEPEGGICGNKRLPLLPKHTLKVQRLNYKTRDSGYQREEEKGQQVREVKGGLNPGGTPEKGFYPQLDSFGACWSLMHKRDT